jgi:hypothetical protein
MRFLESISNAILKRSADELIATLLIAAAIACVMAGFYALRRRKLSPSPAFVGGLALGAGLVGMTLVAGYLEYVEAQPSAGLGVMPDTYPRRPPAGTIWPAAPGPLGSYGGGWSSGFHVVVAADEDGDGRLHVDELTRLVLRADTDGDGLVNFRDIDRLIASRFPSRWRRPGPTAVDPGDRRPGLGQPGTERAAAPRVKGGSLP